MHAIRLRGPWEYEPLEVIGGGPLPSAGKVKMPCDWAATLGSAFRGTVLFKRTFHTPTGLDLGEQVWLVFTAVDGHASVILNDRPIGEFSTSDCPARYNITSLLADDANRLAVQVRRAGDESNGLLGDVRLEIED